MTVDHRLQHAQHGIGTEAVPLGQVIHRLLAGWGKLPHPLTLCVRIGKLSAASVKRRPLPVDIYTAVVAALGHDNREY